MKDSHHDSEKKVTRAAAHETSAGMTSDMRATLPAAQQLFPSVPVVQRSAETAYMPGLGGDGDSSKRDREEKKEDKKEPPSKRQTRGSRAQYDLNRPRLAFQSAYAGVATQQLNALQNISFDQNATLSRPAGAPLSTATYYDFRQKVRDGYGGTPVGPHDHALGGAFVQDGPFRPNYANENIANTPAAINFHDNPGFCGDRRIGIGTWLDWYEVRFQWEVKRRDGVGGTWTSPEVTHRTDSVYNAGADVAVIHASTADATWDVVIQ